MESKISAAYSIKKLVFTLTLATKRPAGCTTACLPSSGVVGPIGEQGRHSFSRCGLTVACKSQHSTRPHHKKAPEVALTASADRENTLTEMGAQPSRQYRGRADRRGRSLQDRPAYPVPDGFCQACGGI